MARKKNFILLLLCVLFSVKGFSQTYNASSVRNYRNSNKIEIGEFEVTNKTGQYITVYLYHPDSPNGVFSKQRFNAGETAYFLHDGAHIRLGSDWGFVVEKNGVPQLGGSKIDFIGDYLNLRNGAFRMEAIAPN